MKTRRFSYWALVALALVGTIISLASGQPVAAQNGYPPPEFPQAGTPGAQPYKLRIPYIAKVPTPTKSYYMRVGAAGFQPVTLGQQVAQEQQPTLFYGGQVLSVLAWGQPCKVSSSPLVYGAYSYSGSCQSMSTLEAHIKNFIDGYCGQMQAISPGSVNQYCGRQYKTVPPVVVAMCQGSPHREQFLTTRVSRKRLTTSRTSRELLNGETQVVGEPLSRAGRSRGI